MTLIDYVLMRRADEQTALERVCNRDRDEPSIIIPTCEVCDGPVLRGRHHPIKGIAVCHDCQVKGWRGGQTCECGGVLHKRDYASCCKDGVRRTRCTACRKADIPESLSVKSDKQRAYDRAYRKRIRDAAKAAGLMEGA